ncbi:MAG: 4Fe-4S dicluster domain-containing protein [Chloroflexi bacterium]|nr:4Fe-4S dicluster domain-containing protein [Chloroflexota bacterium]
MSKDKKPPLTSRRRFVAGAAIVGAVATVELSSLQAYTEHVAEPRKPPLAKGVVVSRMYLCSGCRSCQVACTAFNDGWCQPDLARIPITKEYFEGDYRPQPCSQCEYPVCLYYCPTGALQVDTGLTGGTEEFSIRLVDLLAGKPPTVPGTNARVVNLRECIGCQLCIEGCAKAFDLSRIRFDSDQMIVAKCHLCGGQPQCVRFCPVGAVLFAYSPDGVLYGYDGEGNIRWEPNVKPLREDELKGVLW